MTDSLFRDSADSYRTIGMIVIPAIRGEKRPAVPWKPYQNGVPDEIHSEWKEKFSHCNIGLITGKTAGIITLDYDSEEALHRFEREICPVRDIPTPTVQTPRGFHFHFKYPDFLIRNAVNILGEGSRVDVRGEGGFAVLPPSVLKEGIDYRWLPGRDPRDDVPFAEIPPQLKLFLRDYYLISQSSGSQPLDNIISGVSEGARNESAAKLAGYYFGIGFNYDSVLKLLKDWNSRNQPPLPESELKSVVRSIQNRDLARRRWTKGDKPTSKTIEKKEHSFQIEKIEKINSTPPVYFVYVFGKKISLSSKELISFPGCRTRVVEETNRVIDFPNANKLWLPYIDSLLQSKLIILQTPDEITLDTNIVEEISRYVDEHGSQNTKLIRSRNGAYLHEESVYLPPKFFRDLAKSLDVKVGQIWETVRNLGGCSQIVRLRISEDDEKSKVMRVWIIPLQALSVPNPIEIKSNGLSPNGPIDDHCNGELPL